MIKVLTDLNIKVRRGPVQLQPHPLTDKNCLQQPWQLISYELQITLPIQMGQQEIMFLAMKCTFFEMKHDLCVSDHQVPYINVQFGMSIIYPILIRKVEDILYICSSYVNHHPRQLSIVLSSLAVLTFLFFPANVLQLFLFFSFLLMFCLASVAFPGIRSSNKMTKMLQLITCDLSFK